MAAKIHELRTRRAALVKQANEAMEAAQKAAEADDRELTAEELKAQDDFDAQIARLDAQIDLEQRKIERLAKLGSSAPQDPEEPEEPRVPGSGPQLSGVRDRTEDDPRRGFRSHREFLMSVMENYGLRSRGDVADERLRGLAVTNDDDRSGAKGELVFMLPAAFTPRSLHAAAGSDEQGGYSDPHGGFAVRTSFAPGMLQIGMESDPTAGRSTPVQMTTPMVELQARTDKNHTTSVSGGFVVTRKPEAAAANSSRFEMEKVSLRASSLFGLAFATEEILTDSPISFLTIIDSGFRDQFAFHMLNEKLRGKGGNEYLGVLESPALVTVDAVSGQGAGTIIAENAIDMRARCWGYGNAIWLANHDTYPQLIKMAVVVSDDTAGGLVMVYQSSSREDRPDMLLGRPIFYTENCSALGSEGDIMLVNMSQYLEGLYQPLQSAESVHVRFENHERAFKFWLRNAGAPWWRSALTPAKSAATLSPIVTLAARA